MSALLDSPPLPGHWSDAEVVRINGALAQVGLEWALLYATTAASGARFATWQKRGYEVRIHDGGLWLRLPPPPGIYCACGRHRGARITERIYVQEHIAPYYAPAGGRALAG